MAGTRKRGKSSQARSGAQSKTAQADSPATNGTQGNSKGRRVPVAEVAPATIEPTEVETAAPAASGGWTSRITGKRVLIGVGVVALLLILVGGAYAFWTVQKAMPTINGTASLPGLSAPVTVTRDMYGVPHIVAANVDDLYSAQGYVHAQDRLFQMFYFRQLGAGKLAEAFGAPASQIDIFLRTIGMRRAAEAEWAQASPTVRSALEAYTRGVNAFISTHRDALPLEFNLAGLTMDDWQPVDSIAFGKVMAWDLGGNWDLELIRSDLIDKVGAERAAQLMPGYPVDAPVIVPGANSGQNIRLLQAFNSVVRPWLSFGIEGIGSNNWVVDGSKSATGKPLLANDPHLGVQNPSIWYQVHLTVTGGEHDVVGFSFAGAPGVILGHNGSIAWGATNASADVQDLFVERLDEVNQPGQYLSPTGWKPMQILTETITVKGGVPITHTVRITRHGPLISDALTAISSTIGTTVAGPLSFQWTAAQPGTLLEAVLDLQTAQNWQEFRAALSKWTVPGQNMVYADTEGNIGYQLAGQYPIRKQGDGSVPAEGWSGEYDWNGSVPFDDLPRSYNPPEHYIATANNKPFGPDYKQPIYGEWAAPWRISRIEELLKAKDKLSVEDFKALQLDTRSPMARKAGPILAALKPEDPRAQEAVKLFEGWDGDLKSDSSAVAIYEVTIHRALSETFSDDLGVPLFEEYAGGRGIFQALESLLDRPEDPFWDRAGTEETETRDDILATSLTGAVSDIAGAFGDDMNEWQWGKLHTFTARHTFGGQPLLAGIFNLNSVPVDGDGTTVSVGAYEIYQPFEMISHQSFRMIVDTGDWSNSLAIYATGQSGQPYNKHWGDLLPIWASGEYNPLLYAPEKIEAGKDGVLTLNP